MKTRQSGMPEEKMWREFFDAEAILRAMQVTPLCRDIVDFGCGYGTFTIPAARIVSGTVHALDIESDMANATRAKAEAAGLGNVRICVRDFFTDGTGLPATSVDYVMLFNILHAEQPEVLVDESFRVLSPGGHLGVIHWNYDPATPRGPSMDIRLRPGQCLNLAQRSGFMLLPPGIIDLPPYHYGMVFARP